MRIKKLLARSYFFMICDCDRFGGVNVSLSELDVRARMKFMCNNGYSLIWGPKCSNMRLSESSLTLLKYTNLALLSKLSSRRHEQQRTVPVFQNVERPRALLLNTKWAWLSPSLAL